MKTKRIVLFFFTLFLGISCMSAQERGTYYTDIFGAQVYRNGSYEESIGLDIFGNKQFKNNRGETASLEKDIFGDMIYKDNRSNEVKIDKQVWKTMLEEVHGDVDALFYELIAQNQNRNDSKMSIDVDIMGKEIYKSNNFTEEFWKDIMDTQQYRNSRGETASLRKDLFDRLVYSDSRGNDMTFSTDEWQRMFHRTGGRERAVFRDLINRYLNF